MGGSSPRGKRHRWRTLKFVVLLAALSTIWPVRSSPDETLRWQSYAVSALCAIVALDMLLLLFSSEDPHVRRLHKFVVILGAAYALILILAVVMLNVP